VTTRLPKKPETKTTPSGGVSTAQAATATPPKKDGEKKETQKPIEVVFALDGDHVRMVPVKRGISDDSFVEIVEGANENLQVISGGYKAINRDLEDGKHVKVGAPNEKEDKDEKK
jgi:HlyD family secretion protein